jgi:hypothetical protein
VNAATLQSTAVTAKHRLLAFVADGQWHSFERFGID